ncbi:hypothetical protein MWN34_10770 [Ancylobacter sp. 6x-1]|uniref:Uncharacterized protein n=1 Tax=Ancylobacter crimeensis TaxID=2579147 RepID=A0ABT0DBQ6_9HYPH|nr:hypothetical protein [Ancylobacter crimeensis]MCK0197395.1 hypothetical protein [Ancylobacter crimeensis]
MTYTNLNSPNFFPLNPSRNLYVFGLAYTNDITSNAALKPEEAWNIDVKLDDGQPANGAIMGGRITTCTTATANTDTSATYLFSSSSIGCALIFTKPF